ncbi:hypothetical protein [Marinobacterium aestuariivivens]|uniref:Uncharacterized protein n=1 Tax=Marinobacterium aestuariivivens TaxID=1698799 RepID=A0ABW2A5T3_9GAMM
MPAAPAQVDLGGDILDQVNAVANDPVMQQQVLRRVMIAAVPQPVPLIDQRLPGRGMKAARLPGLGEIAFQLVTHA